MDRKKIRNFAIIAHIDHGKSTLADRLLEITGTVAKRDLKKQHLDSMDLEQERGITIKLNAVQIKYKDYVFHLIDTPGHVDFSYEVSRSLKACEGALLLVDATQGIQAQTLANLYLAIDNDLEVIPIINKVDLASADVPRIKKEIEDVIGISTENAPEISAKMGRNIEDVLEAIIEKIPCPKNADPNKPLKALVFDSYFDIYRGVILIIRIFDGAIKVGDEFQFMNNKNTFHVVELGIKNPNELKKSQLTAGEVGWLAASIRQASDVAVGDTITLVKNPTKEAIPGYKKLNPVVYSGFYPIDGRDYVLLREALEKIVLSDSSIIYEQETSKALGHGFRVGFLGMLHMEITQERLHREFGVNLISTSPSVSFEVYLTNGEMMQIANPSFLPEPTKIEYIKEPWMEANIIIPNQYIGAIMELCQEKRGVFKEIVYIDSTRQNVIYELPLVEIIFNFFNQLKSNTKGYGSLDYNFIGYKKTNLKKVDILLNGEKVDAFSFMVHNEMAYKRSQTIVSRLKEVIPRHNFEIPVQAAIGGKIICRETIKAYRKDVTAKLYGGDRTRRDKLLKKQKIGKKRAKSFGKVDVPQDAFIKVLKNNK